MDTWFESLDSRTMFWIVIGVIIIASMLFRFLASLSRDRTIRELAKSGHQVTPDMFWRGRYGNPVSRGITLIAVGIALFVFFWAMTGGYFGGGMPHMPSWLPFVGVFPFAIGVALLLSGLIGGGGSYPRDSDH